MRLLQHVWLRALVLLAGLLLLNIAAQDVFFRIDLTAEGRYSFSPISLQTLDSIRQPLVIHAYTGGNYPPTVHRFQEAVRTTLNEMQAYAGSSLRIIYHNPAEEKDALQRLGQLGRQPLPIQTEVNELESSERYFFAHLSMVYGDQEEWVDLLKGTLAERDLGMLLRAEQQLEFKLISAMRRLVLQRRPRIGLLTGHKEYDSSKLPEFLAECRQSYDVVEVNLRNGTPLLPHPLPGAPQAPVVDVLLVAQPIQAFTEREKYELDQYIMRGGRVLWLIDQQNISVADLQSTGSALAQPWRLGLDDLFFRYGFKVNYDLVQDASAGYIDVVRTVNGRDVPGQERWLYFPLLRALPRHPITQNVDAVLLRFASSIDTLARPGIRHQVILRSSPYSRSIGGTQVVDFARTMNERPKPEDFEGRGLRTLGLVTSGRFTSLFVGREAPTDAAAPQRPTLPFIEKNDSARMVVIGDGDIILGNHSKQGNPAMPADNKALLFNTIDYLIGDATLTDIRSKEVRLRTLDARKVRGSETLIRVLNVGLPLVLIALFGLGYAWLRRRRYGR